MNFDKESGRQANSSSGDAVRRMFQSYAQTNAQRLRFDRAGLLDTNRRKMFDKAFSVLRRRIATAERILDFGCGGGEFISYISGFSNAEIVGFDPSETQLFLANERLRSASASKVTLVKDSKEISGTFDLIFSHHVIEHIPDDQLKPFLARLESLLTDRGRVVITTPNGLNPSAYAFYMSGDMTHLRMHSPFTLAQLSADVGLEVESVHRELPQAYDLISMIRFFVWKIFSFFAWIQVLTVAGGVRGLRFPLVMWGSFFAVLKRKGSF